MVGGRVNLPRDLPESLDQIPIWGFEERSRFADLELTDRSDMSFYQRFLRDESTFRVLVIPCGPGGLTPLLASRRCQGRMEDSAPGMVALARNEVDRCGAAGRIKVAIADLLEPTVDLGRYDLAIIPREALQLFSADDQKRIVVGLSGRVRPGGGVLIDGVPLSSEGDTHEHRPDYLRRHSPNGGLTVDFRRTDGHRSLTRWRSVSEDRPGRLKVEFVYAFVEDSECRFGRFSLSLYGLSGELPRGTTNLSLVDQFGDYGGARYGPGSPKHILQFVRTAEKPR